MSSPAPSPPAEALDYGFQPGDVQTIDALIELRAERDATRTFITFLADGDQDERPLSFNGLRERGLVVAGELSRRGLRPGDRVLIMLPSGLVFIETFFGIILAGMTPVPVYPPARLARLEHYLRTLASITETAACRAVVMDDRLVPLAGKRLTFKKQLLITDRELRAASEPGEPYTSEPRSPCFLQFTSGTTSQPRGVHLLQEQVMAQLRSYCEALRLAPTETVVSWLPLYHDLGLIGKVLACLYSGSHLVLLSPIDFLKDPMTWLRAISRHQGVHVAAPNFAYELCVRKCTPERMRAEGIDLSSVDNSGMGGEPVSWATVERFREAFAPFGFRGDALNPCYGLAENTLVATGHRRGQPLSTVRVSASGLQRNEVLPPADEADAFVVVGNGGPFPEMEVRITGEDGAELGEDRIGEIWARGPSLADGYLGDAENTAATFVTREGTRWLRTGDLGFVSEGNLYICGRQKDLMIVRGANYHPQDIEQIAGATPGVRVGNVVAFSVDRGDGQGESAVVVAELDPRAARPAEELRQAMIEAVSAAFQLHLAEVVLLPKGSLPKTSSGKLQRGLVKESYLRGDLRSLVPPGGLSTSLLKLKLGMASFGRRLWPSRQRHLIGSDSAQVTSIDPRFAEALDALGVKAEVALEPSLRVDSLGLDSVERVELWLQLEKRFEAKVPEAKWSATQTLGELQALLTEYQGTAPQGADAEDGPSLLVRELLTPLAEEPKPYRRPFTAPLAYGLLSGLSKVFWGWEVQDPEHADQEGGFLLAGNHVTYLDGAWLMNAIPPHVQERLIAYSFTGLPPFTRAFQAQMDTIPINPEGSFREAIRAGIHALRAGKALLIYPEGLRTHSGKMRTFRVGVGVLSLLSQKPIVPFRARGMFEIFPRDRGLPKFFGWRRVPEDKLQIRFGEPIVPPPHDPARTWEQANEILRQLRAAVEAL